MTYRESDDRIVPLSLEDQSSDSNSGNTDAGKSIRNLRDQDRALPVLRDGSSVITRLDRISHRASSQGDAVFNNLFSLITENCYGRPGSGSKEEKHRESTVSLWKTTASNCGRICRICLSVSIEAVTIPSRVCVS